MFRPSLYKKLSIPFPPEGMNKDISKDVSTFSSGEFVENILSDVYGEGHLRNGMRYQGDVLSANDSILYSFFYNNTLFLVSISPSEVTYSDINVQAGDNYFTITLDENAVLRTGEKIRFSLEFADGSVIIVDDYIDGLELVTTSIYRVYLTETRFTISANQNILELFSFKKKITAVNYNTLEEISSIELEDSRGITIAERFLSDVFFCDGVNDVIVYENNIFRVYTELVKFPFTYISSTGSTAGEIKVTFRTIENDLSYYNSLPCAVVTNGVRFDFVMQNLTKESGTIYIINFTSDSPLTLSATSNFFEYKKLPKFSFLKTFQGRLYALGEGLSSNIGRSYPDSLLVFYASRSGVKSGWFSDAIKDRTVPFIDTGSSINSNDSLENISVLGDSLLLIGRNKTQVWVANRDVGNVSQTPIIFKSELNAGVFHPLLALETPNDVNLFTDQGFVSLSTLNIGNQLFATPYTAIASKIKEKISVIRNNNVTYNQVRTFYSLANNLIGFKIDNTESFVCRFLVSPLSWSIFSGQFSNCSDYFFDNQLNLCSVSGRSFYLYDISRFEDSFIAGNNTVFNVGIKFTWRTKKVNTGNLLSASNFVELLIKHNSNFPKKNGEYLTLSINDSLLNNKNYSFPLTLPPVSSEIGNILDNNFLIDIDEKIYRKKIKVLVGNPSFTLEGLSFSPLVIKEINIYGTLER